jgi:integrase
MLTDLNCRNAQAPPRKHYDTNYGADGVERFYLFLHPTNGSKYFRLRFKLADGIGRDLPLGTYGKTSLKDARAEAVEANAVLKAGGDPRTARKQAKLAKVATETNTFRVVADSWRDVMENTWSPKHRAMIEQRIKAHLLPSLGDMPVRTIQAMHVLAAVKKISARGNHSLARRVMQYADCILTHAVACGLLEDAPRSMRDAVKKPPPEKHHDALSEAELPEFLRKLEGIESVQTRCAIKLLLLSGTRTHSLTGARWDEFDLKSKLWTVPPVEGRVKGKTGTPRFPHLVPLSEQACEVLSQLPSGQPNPASGSPIDLERLVFPSISKSGHMSPACMRRAIQRLGYKGKQTPHGFRRQISTLMVERGADPDVCDLQLSHLVGSSVSRVYNSAKRLPERAAMLQKWAYTLDELRDTR